MSGRKKYTKRKPKKKAKKKNVPGWYVELNDGRHGHIQAGCGMDGNKTKIWIETGDGVFADEHILVDNNFFKRLYIINLTWDDILKTQ